MSEKCECKTTEGIMIKDGVTVSRCTYGCGRLIAEMTTLGGYTYELKELPAWFDGEAGALRCDCDLCETRRAAEAEAERLAKETTAVNFDTPPAKKQPTIIYYPGPAGEVKPAGDFLELVKSKSNVNFIAAGYCPACGAFGVPAKLNSETKACTVCGGDWWVDKTEPAGEVKPAGDSCQWRQGRPDVDNWFIGSCGKTHEFINSGPIDNGFRFCPYCGRPLVETEGQP